MLVETICLFALISLPFLFFIIRKIWIEAFIRRRKAFVKYNARREYYLNAKEHLHEVNKFYNFVSTIPLDQDIKFLEQQYRKCCDYYKKVEDNVNNVPVHFFRNATHQLILCSKLLVNAIGKADKGDSRYSKLK